jgi:hypothetical protein
VANFQIVGAISKRSHNSLAAIDKKMEAQNSKLS